MARGIIAPMILSLAGLVFANLTDLSMSFVELRAEVARLKFVEKYLSFQENTK